QGAVTATGSASEISNFKSQIRGAVTATGSASEISNFKSQMLIPGPGEQQTASAAPRAESFPENDFVSPDEHGSALEESLDRFWEGDPEIESMQFTIARPEVDAAPIKLLGPPPFWNEKGDFIAEMESMYRAISEAAIKTALGD